MAVPVVEKKAAPAVGSARPRAATGAQSHSRPPQQERSRQSFDRALDAAVELMAERGTDAFTLADVARRAGVSIGSIYGRVDSKDDLIRSVQARELARIDHETTKAFNRLPTDCPDFEKAVSSTIRVTAEVLRRNAAVLGPLMIRANVDPVLAAAGRLTHEAMLRRFTLQILAHPDAINHPDPDGAVAWTFTVVYSVIARYLGLGSSRESAGQGSWKAMLTNLTEMTVSFLTRPR